MAYPSEYYTKAQEIIDKRRFENSLKAEKRLREVRSKIPEIVEIDSKLSKTIDELAALKSVFQRRQGRLCRFPSSSSPFL